MRNMINRFRRDETGAVTVDWVALTAGIVVIGIAITYTIFNGGINDIAVEINDTLDNAATDLGAVTVPTLTSTPGTSTSTSGSGG